MNANISKMNKISGIYLITNKINGKKYVGCSIDIKSRWKAHINNNVVGLGKAITKYGAENFTFEVLLECPNICFDFWECHFITKHNSIAPDGYNLTGGGNVRKYVSAIARHKMSIALKGKKKPQSVIDGLKGNKFGLGNKGNVNWVRDDAYRNKVRKQMTENNPNGIAIEVNGVKYKTVKEFASSVGIPYTSIIRYINEGSLTSKLKKRLNIEVEWGVLYD